MKTVLAIKYGKTWAAGWNIDYDEAVCECTEAKEDRVILFIDEDRKNIGRAEFKETKSLPGQVGGPTVLKSNQ